MALEHWLAFLAASTLLLALPGPTVLLVVSYALGHGRKPAAAIITGVALGDLTAMTASMLGLGAVLAASATLFSVLRWIGGAYLVYLGVKLWRTPVQAQAVEAQSLGGQSLGGQSLGAEALETQSLGAGSHGAAPPVASPVRIMTHAYITAALNPKLIIFFVAFVPQFMDAARPFLPQVVILETTFVLLAVLNTTLYAALASAIRDKLHQPRVQRLINRAGGSLLVGAGLFTAGWRGAGR
jgi:threonine/homoserine/homoserine lactone efflux protein